MDSSLLLFDSSLSTACIASIASIAKQGARGGVPLGLRSGMVKKEAVSEYQCLSRFIKINTILSSTILRIYAHLNEVWLLEKYSKAYKKNCKKKKRMIK
jgi:hypothetical protein